MTKHPIALPLPDSRLSPNARKSWHVTAPLKKSHRTRAKLEASYTSGLKFSGYQLHFYYPNKRVRDKDNAGASCKSYMDGISDACGQDDSEWEHNGIRFHTDKENPRVEIVMEEVEEE